MKMTIAYHKQKHVLSKIAFSPHWFNVGMSNNTIALTLFYFKKNKNKNKKTKNKKKKKKKQKNNKKKTTKTQKNKTFSNSYKFFPNLFFQKKKIIYSFLLL